MTEPPRPPGAGEPGAQPPGETPPSAPYGSNEPPTAPLSGAPTGPGYPPPGGYPPPPGDQPPSGGYPPPGGYAAPGAGYPAGGAYGAPAGYASSDDKTWALVAHFGGAAGMFIGGGVLGWVAPLVALLARGNQSPTVRAHAVAALNFQLIWSIIALVGWILTCILIGIVVGFAAMIIGIVFGILGGVKANEGQLYRYPMSANLIK
ncbi:hypothetical protein GA0074695_1661 [Micromonospora viridifaciens]|uniref:DUF4870 domain-containing protein n=1 Tax=Micromonospora viridifaciens TaxID=1881 RepID=A0A1C4VPK3_MICVI|nr:DUF4870 domain-containing protein [Micromonospora viridifaciens]SCE85916.1 hypothetical protein GA0074695_1661 [Micromonospora viridifaciens]